MRLRAELFDRALGGLRAPGVEVVRFFGGGYEAMVGWISGLCGFDFDCGAAACAERLYGFTGESHGGAGGGGRGGSFVFGGAGEDAEAAINNSHPRG